MRMHIAAKVQEKAYKPLVETAVEESPYKTQTMYENKLERKEIERVKQREREREREEGPNLEERSERTWRGERRPEERERSRNFQREGLL
jgi:hypothetical protein